jgi:DNA polymerase-1
MDRESVKELLGVYPHQVADYKAICGDVSDNLKGIRGIGKKGASLLINEFGSLRGVYDNINKIKGRKRELLEKFKEDAFHSLSLTKLHCSVEECNPVSSDGSLDNIPWNDVDKFFQNLGFRLLSKRLRNMNLIEEKKDEQMSLF